MNQSWVWEVMVNVWMRGVCLPRPRVVRSSLLSSPVLVDRPPVRPLNSMYDTPYQLSLVWRATVPLSDCWVQHYSGRGERGAPWHVLVAVVRVARWRVLWRGSMRRDACGGGRRGACRAPGHAPPSRTTRMDTWCTGPDMSWERDVRVHTVPYHNVHYTHTHTHLHTYNTPIIHIAHHIRYPLANSTIERTETRVDKLILFFITSPVNSDLRISNISNFIFFCYIYLPLMVFIFILNNGT